MMYHFYGQPEKEYSRSGIVWALTLREKYRHATR